MSIADKLREMAAASSAPVVDMQPGDFRILSARRGELITPSDLRARVREMVHRHGVEIIVLDCCQDGAETSTPPLPGQRGLPTSCSQWVDDAKL